MSRDRFSKEVQDSLPFSLFGEVFPHRPAPPPLAVDHRTIALRALRAYLAELIFVIQVAKEPDGTWRTEHFKVPKKNIFVSVPEASQEVQFPSIVMLGEEEGRYETLGLNNYWDEKTYGVYGKGTVVQWQDSYVENITLEIWANTRPQLWSLLAGIETALTPTETRYGVYFQLKEYFNQICCFTPVSRRLLEDAGEAMLNRRRGHVKVELRMNRVALVNARTIEPVVEVNVDAEECACEPGDETP